MKTPSSPPFVRALIFNVAGLVIVLGLALLITMVWQGIATTEAATRQEISETLNRSVERLRILARAAEMTQESVERVVRTVGVSGPMLRPALEASLAAFEQRPELSYLGIALSETGEYGCLERTPTGAILLRLFPGTRTDVTVTRNFILTDQGFVLQGESPGGYDPRAQPFYQAAINNPSGGIWIPSYPWIIHAAGKEALWGFSYVKAIPDAAGRPVGVLDTDFDMLALNGFLRAVAAEFRCELQVVELGKEPRVIGGAGSSRVPLPPAGWLASLAGFPGEVFVDRLEAEGERRWVAARRMTLKGGVPWLVVASRKDPFIEAALRRQLYQVIGMGLAIAAGLVLVSVRVARRFGRPLAELEQRVAGFGQSGPDAAVPPVAAMQDGFRETQLLDEAFTRMAVAVRQREQELATQNSRLVVALEENAAVEARTSRQRDALIGHTEQRVTEDDLAAAQRRLLESGAATLAVTRASVWRYNADQSLLACGDLFDLRTQEHSSGLELAARDYPVYFRAMAEGEVMAVDDACADPRTREFVGGYFRPLGIGAMLDVPLHVGGKVVGILRHEHVGGARGWTADEKSFAVAMANLVSLGLEGEERRLLQEQFLRAQRMEAIGTLASGLAHDLNNILAPMLMAAALLKMKLTSERDQKMVTMIESGATRGSGIIRQLLTFGRGVEGARTTVQLRHLVKDLVHIVQETFPRDLKLEHSVPTDLWLVAEADATQLHQVLLNLSVNARDAMPRGGRLAIRTENVRLEPGSAALPAGASPGAYIRLTVADTGDGIPPEIISRIFDPFFTTKPVGKGTGLGLSSVLTIVKNHGGFLKVTSTPGVGSTFEIHFPALETAAVADTTGVADELSRGEGQLVLVVDDEPAMQQAVREMLELHGYHVVLAENGEAAVRRFVEHRGAVQLVLTDVEMPVMSGIELIHSLRILEKDLRFVVISGSTSVEKHAEVEQLGIKHILGKPCDAARLLRAVHDALAG